MDNDGKSYAIIVASTAYHIDKFTWGQIHTLQKLGFEVHVAASFNAASSGNSSSEYIEKCRENFICQGVKVHDLPFTRLPLSRNNLKALRMFKNLLKQTPYSLLHCHTPTGGLIARIAAARWRKGGLTVVYTAHGFHFFKGAPKKNWLLYYPVERLLARVTDCLIVINEEDNITARKMPAKRLVKINGAGVRRETYENIVPADRADVGISPDSFVFLCVGEVNKGKNQELLIRSFVTVSQQCHNAMLLLAGEGAMLTIYKKLAVSLGLTEKILFLGWRDDIPALVSMADVAVSASRREGLPVSLVEAMMAGKPLIASPCRGNRELAEQGGIVADGEKEFTKAMLLLYKDAERRAELGAAAKAASKQYEASVIDAEIEKVYLSLLSSS